MSIEFEGKKSVITPEGVFIKCFNRVTDRLY